MPTRTRSSALVAATLLALAGCGGGDDGDDVGETQATGQEIEISETDFALDPSNVELDEPGTYTFRAVNNGDTTHALEIEGHGLEEETDEIGPGESAEVTVEITEPGTYEMYCPIGNHKDMGMEGDVVVGGTAGGAGTGTDEDESETETESSGYG